MAPVNRRNDARMLFQKATNLALDAAQTFPVRILYLAIHARGFACASRRRARFALHALGDVLGGSLNRTNLFGPIGPSMLKATGNVFNRTFYRGT